ncbi:MAG: bifunctional demethylmenaquinone methyltransferase/2-methoxy-6-polyprenyl-1,4-benzoquinol methylase UbiE [Candidatus Hodarchaeales archaeon]
MDKSQRTMMDMFNNIAHHYDLMNNIMTGLSHKITRKRAVKLSNFGPRQKALDLATGTGDFAFELLKMTNTQNMVIGVDLSNKMLSIANSRANKMNLKGIFAIHQADICNLPYKDETFDLCTIGYGIRNIQSPSKALQEIARVTKKKGRLIIVEATLPTNRHMRVFADFYFRKIVPIIAKFFASDVSSYHYLAKSISHFPTAHQFAKILQLSNWRKVFYFQMLLGTVTILHAVK